MAQDQTLSAPDGDKAHENGDEGSSLPLRRYGRARKRPSNHSGNADSESVPSAKPPVSPDARRNPKRKAAPEIFDVPDDLLEASLGPWKENEQAEWPSWIELESDPAFFTAIIGLLGVKGARIEEVLSVDEDSLATLPAPVYGLVFLYEYVAEKAVEPTETSRDVWFANQTTDNACATIALLNIIMNAEGLALGEKLRKFKEESNDLSPPLRGNMINNSAWIRTAHNSFARRLDLLNAALALQNEVDNRKKRAKSSAKQKKKARRDKTKADKSGGSSAYHFIAFVPVGQQVWQLDGLTSTPVCIGSYEPDKHWTSVMRPVLEERMMRYETERLSFSLLALCGDVLAPIRQKLAANIRALADLAPNLPTPDGENPAKQSATTIHTLTDPRLATYQLDAEDILAAPKSPSHHDHHHHDQQHHPDTKPPSASSLWTTLTQEQEHILSEYTAAKQEEEEEEEAKMGGQEPAAILGRTKDYTGAVHGWVQRLAEHGVLRRLHEEVRLQSGL